MGDDLETGLRILVVVGEEALRSASAAALRPLGVVDAVRDARAATALLGDRKAVPYDAVVSDLRLPRGDGLSVLRAARARDPRTRVVLLSAWATLDVAVDAMRQGAADFVAAPFDPSELASRVARALGRPLPVPGEDPEREDRTRRAAVVAESPGMREALDLALRVAPTRSTVLITGETGTGKEIVAGLIHDLSPRSGGPFVKVNCAALPETLLESELFGHERGAFTGADRQRIGRFEQASGGTLFLDEIGDMSPATQAKLLRVLQDQEFHRLGGTRTLRTEARIVAATNRDLAALLREGRFRDDLYFRLNVIGIHLPPLRERPEDAVALAYHFLAELSREVRRPPKGFSDAALARIREYRWSGNVRELRNAVERALLLCEGEWIGPDDLTSASPHALDAPWPGSLPPDGVALADVERQLVLMALERAGFVQKEAASLLRVSRRKLNYMVRRMGLTHPSWRRNRGDAPGEGPVDDAEGAEARRAPAGDL